MRRTTLATAALLLARALLGAAFSAIEETPGATDAYLRDALGIDDALRAQLRANLLE